MRVIGAVLACVLVLFSVIGIVRANRRAARHADATARVESMVEALASVNHRREPLGSQVTNDRAWAHYDLAFKSLESLNDYERSAAFVDVDEGVRADQATRAEVAARWGERFEAVWARLERGAQCIDASPFSNSQSVAASTQPVARNFSNFRTVLGTMSLDGLALMEAGEGERGAARILTAMQVAEDFTRSPLLVKQVLGLHGLSPQVVRDYLGEFGFAGLGTDGLSRLFEGTERLLGRCASDSFKPAMRGEVVAFWHFGGSSVDVDDDRLTGNKAVTEHVRFCDEYLRGQAGNDLLEIYRHGLSVAESEGRESTRGKFAFLHASVASNYRRNVVQLGLLRIALARVLAPLEEADPRLQGIAEGNDFVDPFGGTLEIGSDEGVTVYRVRPDGDSLPVIELSVREGSRED